MICGPADHCPGRVDFPTPSFHQEQHMDRLTEFYVRAENALAAMADAEDGATAVEYGLIIALVAAAIIIAVTALGTKIATVFNDVTENL